MGGGGAEDGYNVILRGKKKKEKALKMNAPPAISKWVNISSPWQLKKNENQQYSTQCSPQINSLRLQNEVTQGDPKDLLQPVMAAHI